jgi:hypothetical protein
MRVVTAQLRGDSRGQLGARQGLRPFGRGCLVLATEDSAKRSSGMTPLPRRPSLIGPSA